jgi:hypothetical protein
MLSGALPSSAGPANIPGICGYLTGYGMLNDYDFSKVFGVSNLEQFNFISGSANGNDFNFSTPVTFLPSNFSDGDIYDYSSGGDFIDF